MSWSPFDLLPGLWVAVLATGLGFVLRRWFDPIPRRAWILWAVALAILLGPVLFGGRVLLPLGYLTKVPPFRELWTRPEPPPGNLLQSDTVLQITPWMIQVREAYAAGEWPLWNHLSGAGEPLLGNPQTQAWQPLVWPALILPVAQGIGVTAAVRVLCAFVFLFLLLRRQGISEGPALAASTAYGLGGGLILWLNWPMGNTAALLPLLLYGIVLVDQRGAGQDRALLALAVMAFLCAGHPETILHGSLLAAAFAVSRLAAGPPKGRFRTLAAWGLAALIGAGLAAPALLTAAGYLPQSLRVSLLASRESRIAAQDPFAGLKEGARAESVQALARRLIPVAAPNAFGNSRFGEYWGESNSNEDAAGFVSTAAMLAALLAFAGSARRFPQERVVMAATIIGLVVLARPPGLDQLLNAIPVLRSSLTFHHRVLLTLGLCIAYLAACTWERWRLGLLSQRRVILAATAFGVLCLWSYLGHPGPAGALEGLRRASLAIQVAVILLSLLLGWAAAPLARGGGKAEGQGEAGEGTGVRVVLASIVAAELLFFHLPANPPVTARLFYPETPPIRYVRERLGPWMRMAGLGPALRANFASVYGLADPRSSNPAKPASYVEAVSRINLTPGRATDGFGEPRDSLYQLLGVRYLMTLPDSPLPGPWKLALRHPSAWVWERPRALPRIFLPHSAHPCAPGASWSDCTRSIRSFRRETAIREGQDWSAASPRASELNLGTLHSAWLSAHARLVEPRLLASSIYQDGGWIVLKNGDRQPATLANGPFVAAWLPEGDARIDLVYRPRGFFGGMLLAALALTAAAGLWMPVRR